MVRVWCFTRAWDMRNSVSEVCSKCEKGYLRKLGFGKYCPELLNQPKYHQFPVPALRKLFRNSMCWKKHRSWIFVTANGNTKWKIGRFVTLKSAVLTIVFCFVASSDFPDRIPLSFCQVRQTWGPEGSLCRSCNAAYWSWSQRWGPLLVGGSKFKEAFFRFLYVVEHTICWDDLPKYTNMFQMWWVNH